MDQNSLSDFKKKKKKEREKKQLKYWIDWNDVFVFQRQIVNQFHCCQIFRRKNVILFILQLSYFPTYWLEYTEIY